MSPEHLISSVGSTTVSTLTLVSFVKDLKNTPLHVKTCINLTTLITTDLNYLVQLWSTASNASYLSENPDLARRIGNIIISTEQAILDVCRLLEGCRQEVYGEASVPVKERLKWVLGDSMGFKRREGNLQAVHRAVLSEVTFLRMRESAGETVSRVMESVIFENVELLEMGHRRREERMTKSEVVEIKDEELEKGAETDCTLDNEASVEPTGLTTTQGMDLFESLNSSPGCKLSEKLNLDLEVPLLQDTTPQSSPASWIKDPRILLDDDVNEGDDLEEAFYRDLKRQEDERQRRLLARRHQTS